MNDRSATPALVARHLHKRFRRETGEIVEALDDVSMTVASGTLTALVGPDGAGKTTLIRLATGLLDADGGRLDVLGIDVNADPQTVQSRIGYMPQRFGLYEDLTVRENLDLYADLHGVTAQARAKRYPQLMEMTALAPFATRLAGRLSGGMKQKLGLACTLVRSPELLLLDEPTVGVDPLSRRELWDIVRQLLREGTLTVVVSTSYLDEADACDHAVVLYDGRVLAQGPPADVRALAAKRTFRVDAGDRLHELQVRLLDLPDVVDARPEAGRVRVVTADSGWLPPSVRDLVAQQDVTKVEPRFEDGFMVLLREKGNARIGAALAPGSAKATREGEFAVDVRDLVRRFGAFTAVDRVTFDVRRGEIFGLLGPNGAGKTTTFRMLCGLLPATSGTLRVAGVDLRIARASARQRIGYVAQSFALYGQLTVVENLQFFGSAYGLRGKAVRDRIDRALRDFELAKLAHLPSRQLPGGYKQRLAMAAALLHEPETLFLDEPTSGADPLARREFWRRITALAAHGVTVIVTTHFMEEAEYCDRIAILDSGKLLAQGTPAAIRGEARGRTAHEPTMEDAFVAIVEKARAAEREDRRVEAVS